MQARDYLVDKASFGQDAAARWRTDLPADAAAGLAAAGVQHRAAIAVRLALNGRPLTLLAAAIGGSDSTLGRKLGGELTASLIDITKWGMAVTAGALEALPRDPKELLPPSHRAGHWEPGRLQLPRLDTNSVPDIDWKLLVEDLSSWFGSEFALGSARAINPHVIRHHLTRYLCERGIDSEQLHFEEIDTDAGPIAMSLGVRPSLSVETAVLFPASVPLAVTRNQLSLALAAFARLATAVVGDRAMVIVATPKALHELGLGADRSSVGSPIAEALGLPDPLPGYWEATATMRATASSPSEGGGVVVTAYEVTKEGN